MWILPKQLLTSHFVQDTEASTLDLEEFCRACEHALMWRSKPSLARTWLQRCKNKKTSWMSLLFGQTLEPSMHCHFVDKWTSSLEDSHASHSVTQGNEKVQTILDICSQKSKELSESVNLECSSSKMSKGLFPPSTEELNNRFSTMSLEDWNQWVTEQRQAYLARKNASIRTGVRESSSQVCNMENWGTPQASDHVEGARTKVTSNQKCLGRDLNQMANWPTPTGIHADRGNHDEPLENYEKRVEDYEEGKTKGKPGKSLGVAARMNEVNWATPQVTDSTRDNQIRKSEDLTDAAKKGGCKNLREDVQNWATPTTINIVRTEEGMKKRKEYRESIGRKYVEGCLEEQMNNQENWATPQSRDYKDTTGVSLKRKNPRGKERGTNGALPLEVYSQAAQENPNTSGNTQEQLVTRKLSPLWVAQLMGLPTATFCVINVSIHCAPLETE